MLLLYFPILIFIAFGILVGVIATLAGKFIAPKRPYAAKLAAYECGFPAFGEARLPFNVRYYLIAILFIIFDLETAFLFPWAVALRQIGQTGLLTMALFMSLLLLGFLYEWKKGALEWE